MYGGVEFWLLKEAGNQSYRVVHPIELKVSEIVYPQTFSLPEPSGRIPMTDFMSIQKSFIEEAVMQGLMADPSQEKGELKAMREHLKDLQKYVDSLLKAVTK
jgi:hypothetical protein